MIILMNIKPLKKQVFIEGFMTFFYLDSEKARWLCSYCKYYENCDYVSHVSPKCSLLESIEEYIRETFKL